MQINISSRAKRLRIQVRPGGEVVATLPYGISRAVLDKFIVAKTSWIVRAVARMKKVSSQLKLPRADYRARRSEALRLVKSRIADLNQVYGFKFSSVTIRNQKSRWGSCSRRGNLSFNYRLLLLPPELADYVIVHELCHLQELNHSKKFWALVALAIPDPKKVRRELKHYSLRLG